MPLKSPTIAKNERQRLIELLIKQLQKCSDLKTKQWFDNYLKGAIKYRGVKTPKVARLLKEWRLANKLDIYTPQQQLILCSDLIASSFAEDKFAGIIYLHKFLIAEIDYQILLSKFNSLFKQGCFFDWSTTDWFCLRVLDPIIINNGINAAETVSKWRYSENFWQRRASIVSFRHASLNQDYHPLIETIISDLVKEDKRFIQTGIGWVLADMSKNYPIQVEALFRKYLHQLDKEVIDRHSKHLPCHRELKQQKRKLK
ncbi:MAG: DNA alkylation repair protein [Cyanobacteria bacterium P01_E01_bin.35]